MKYHFLSLNTDNIFQILLFTMFGNLLEITTKGLIEFAFSNPEKMGHSGQKI